MPISEAKKKANKKYDNAKMAMIGLSMQKSERDKIDSAAAAAGMPVSQFCRRCIAYCIDNNIDLSDTAPNKTE